MEKHVELEIYGWLLEYGPDVNKRKAVGRSRWTTYWYLTSIHQEVLLYSYLLYVTESGILGRQERAAKLETILTHLLHSFGFYSVEDTF